ncbi:MAG: inositol monophosphatase [Halobacteriaceae archaeon]
MTQTDRASVALTAARRGGEAARAQFREGVAVETKGRATDYVTAADREAQRRVVETVREAFPEDAVVGEEDGHDRPLPESGAAWVVDPIDGTGNYVRNLPMWATSVAAVVDGETVAAANVMPALDDEVVLADGEVERNGDPMAVSEQTAPETFHVAPTLWWERDERDTYADVCEGLVTRFDDLRRYGSAQFALSAVATGAIEAAVSTEAGHPWDTVAGVAMVRAAGGVVTDPRGERWHPDSEGLVASNGEAHDAVLAALPDPEE